MKRRTREVGAVDWRLDVSPRFGNMPVGSVTAAEVSNWLGSLLVSQGVLADKRHALPQYASLHPELRGCGRGCRPTLPLL